MGDVIYPSSGILWIMYRDDRVLVGPLEKAQACLAAYQKKTGKKANKLGVASSFPESAEMAMRETGVEVIHNLPAWACNEIWVGMEEK